MPSVVTMVGVLTSTFLGFKLKSTISSYAREPSCHGRIMVPSKWRLFSEIIIKISTSDKFPIIYLSVNKFHHCVHFENVLPKHNAKRLITNIWLYLGNWCLKKSGALLHKENYFPEIVHNFN